MDANTIIILILIGLAAGMLSGLVGVGGGIIIVPALVYALAFSQKAAQGTSLGLLMLPVGILAVWQYHKQGYVDFKIIGYVAIGFVAGSFLGSKISLSLSDDKLKKVFAIIMLLLSLKMLFFDKPKKEINSPAVTTGEDKS
jgi:uncharacterized protein